MPPGAAYTPAGPEGIHFLPVPNAPPASPLTPPDTLHIHASGGIYWSTVALLQISMTPHRELLHAKDLLPMRVTI